MWMIAPLNFPFSSPGFAPPRTPENLSELLHSVSNLCYRFPDFLHYFDVFLGHLLAILPS